MHPLKASAYEEENIKYTLYMHGFHTNVQIKLGFNCKF